LKSLLQLTNITTSNLLSVKRHLSGLNIRPATLKSRLLNNFKIADYFF